MQPRVYLAGPISGMEYEGAVEWRNWAQEWLRACGIRAYSPMRGKEFLAAEEAFGRLPVFMNHSNPLASSRGIMCRDYNDCVNADALLVNFIGVTRVSQGTVMELAWAYHLGIPTVVVSEERNPNIWHPMVHETIDYRYDTLDEGVAQIQSILLPEGT